MTETVTEIKTSKELLAHYKSAIKYLDENYAYFLTQVLRIGRPQWVHIIETAAVMMQMKEQNESKRDGDEDDELDFEFIFNPKFASQLSTKGLAFVLAHEAMHIVLNHLRLGQKYLNPDRVREINKKIKERKRLSKKELADSIRIQQVQGKLNIAMDCVINDYLAMAGLEVLEQACRGTKFIGEDAAFLTVRDVYERLPNQPRQQCSTCGGTGKKPEDDDQGQGGGQGDQDKNQGGAGNQHGKGKGESCPDCGGSGYGVPGESDGDVRGEGAIDSHDWLFDPDFADKYAQAVEDLAKEIEASGEMPQDLQDKRTEEDGGVNAQQQALRDSMKAGTEQGNIREFQQVHGLSMAWVKLLKEIDPDIFKEPGIEPPPMAAWHKRPRKLGAAGLRRINMPVYKKHEKKETISREKPAIVLALDYSGSIGPNDADRFATLAMSIPAERIKLFACTFTTTYREFDIENPHGGGGGGTDFDAVGQFIEQKVKPQLNGSYPKAVVIITDGQAPFDRYLPVGNEQDSWLWLISPVDRSSGYTASRSIGRRAMLEEYILS